VPGLLFLYRGEVDITLHFIALVLLVVAAYFLWRTSELGKRRQLINYLRKLHKTDPRRAYRMYIASDLWEAKRQEAFAYFGNRCAGCNTPFGLEGHHRTYAHLFDERLGEVVPFCRACHARLPRSADLYKD
jgi:hypothetical protein